VIPSSDPRLKFKRPSADSQPDEFTPADIARARERIDEIEKILPESEYSGRYRWLAPFRCPHCHNPFIDFRNNLFRKAWEYYLCCHRGHELVQFSSDMIKKKDDETKQG
jgi:pyruvate-formate lyase-activating enzyme